MNYIKIGTIVNTRGIKGQLKVKSLTDFQADRYQKGAEIFIFHQNRYKPFIIHHYENHKGMDLLTLKGLEDINQVLPYKGCDIFVPEDDDVYLEDNEYHLSELLDCEVFQNQVSVGRIVGVRELPQGDYLVIKTNDNEEKLVPFRDEFVLSVNLERQRIDIIAMEGLL